MGKARADDETATDEKLVPVKILISEAGLGLRKGEIRGYAPDMAAKLIANKHAEAVEVPKTKAEKA